MKLIRALYETEFGNVSESKYIWFGDLVSRPQVHPQSRLNFAMENVEKGIEEHAETNHQRLPLTFVEDNSLGMFVFLKWGGYIDVGALKSRFDDIMIS